MNVTLGAALSFLRSATNGRADCASFHAAPDEVALADELTSRDLLEKNACAEREYRLTRAGESFLRHWRGV